MDISVRFRINTPRVIYETIDKEVIAIDFDSGIYYSLNKTGSKIWSTIESGATLSQVIDEILHRYSGDHSAIEESIARFIAQLSEEELIVPSSKDAEEIIEQQVRNEIKNKQQPFNAPTLSKYSHMQELLLLDPIHEVDETGWPTARPEPLNESK